MTEGIADTQAAVRVRLPRPPKHVAIGGQEITEVPFDRASGTALLRFPNSVSPIAVNIAF